MSVPIITVDGPAASGKTSLAYALAQRLAYHVLISGALYRSVAYLVQQKNDLLEDKKLLVAEIMAAKISFRLNQQGVQLWLNNQDLSELIRSEACAELASRLSEIKEVRAALIGYQRSFRVAPGLLAEGRDMGTVVFPEAKLKLYLTANSAARARRRYQQLRQSKVHVKIKEVHQQIIERDRRDMSRATSPLQYASDTVLIDNTKQSLEQTITHVLKLKKAIYG